MNLDKHVQSYGCVVLPVCMLHKRVIHPSKSLWTSPIVLVSKKDGDSKFCIDNRKLNLFKKINFYPPKRINDVLDSFSEVCLFSTLDLASGFWQVKFTRESSFFCHPSWII